MQVIAGGQASLPRTIPLAPASPGIFTFSMDGKGAGAITHVDGSPVSLQAPAHPGELVILYATGLGPVSPAVASGAVATTVSATLSPVTVLVGGTSVVPEFAGLTGCCVGLNQVNFRVPANQSAGDGIPVVLSIAGVRSNFVTLAVH